MFTKLLGTLKHHTEIFFCVKYLSFFKVPKKNNFDTLTYPEEMSYIFALLV